MVVGRLSLFLLGPIISFQWFQLPVKKLQGDVINNKAVQNFCKKHHGNLKVLPPIPISAGKKRSFSSAYPPGNDSSISHRKGSSETNLDSKTPTPLSSGPQTATTFQKKILKVATSLGCMFRNKNTWLYRVLWRVLRCVKYNVLQPTSKGIISSHEIQVINQQPSILHGWSFGCSM